MSKQKIGIGIIVIAIIALAVVMSGLLTILPELDNRITYFDKVEDMSSFVRTNFGIENNKFACYTDDLTRVRVYNNPNYGVSDIFTISPSSAGGLGIPCHPTKDFTRLSVFIRWQSPSNSDLLDIYGSGTVGMGNTNAWHNTEIQPDNLNIGQYYIFNDGEFVRRITATNDKILIYSGGINIVIDSFKYIPIEAYTIRNDEVWVKEVRTGGSYSYSNLNWEMIGFQSQIRPATIRNLVDQTEVPAPQIYVSLINNKVIDIQPNEIHTFYYRTKWVSGLDSSCQGNLDQVEVKQSDGTWKCEGFVKETPIIQQCQVASDCPILPECESQKSLISCNNNLCDFTAFSPACKNQLITYQEKVIEIENTKFIPLLSGTNSFYCFFNDKQTSCNIGEKTISVSAPSYTCPLPSDSSAIVTITDNNINCWNSILTFNGQSLIFVNNNIENDIGFGIKAESSASATLKDGKTRDDWANIVKITLPDDFLEIKTKELGNKFVLQNSQDKITFTITNKLGFGIDGGYTIQTQNLALEGGAVLRDDSIPLFLKNGDNEITYDFKTSQLGTIVDIIGAYGKISTDRDYILKSSQDKGQKYLILTKEIVTSIPLGLENVKPITEIIEAEKPSLWQRFWNWLISLFS